MYFPQLYCKEPNSTLAAVGSRNGRVLLREVVPSESIEISRIGKVQWHFEIALQGSCLIATQRCQVCAWGKGTPLAHMGGFTLGRSSQSGF